MQLISPYINPDHRKALEDLERYLSDIAGKPVEAVEVERVEEILSWGFARNIYFLLSELGEVIGLNIQYFEEKLTKIPETILHFSNSLLYLNLRDNQIRDISPLEKLTKLTELNLASNQISKISSLKKLTKLTKLDLRSNQICDITPLEKLTKLTELDLSSNQISDITPLEKLTNLTWLALSYNRISNINPLKKLTKLSRLYLENNQITLNQIVDFLKTREKSINVSFFTNAKAEVKEDRTIILDLSDSQISDISPLEKLTQLTKLNLIFNKISDITPLEKLTNLTWLALSYNRISNINPLKKLTKLSRLYLENNQITLNQIVDFLKTREKSINVSFFTNAKAEVKEDRTIILDLSDSQISDISPLENLYKLTVLNLSNNQISDISSLKDLTKLNELYLSNNQLSDISPLKELTKLEYIDLRSNQIKRLPEWIVDREWFRPEAFEGNPLEAPPWEVVEQGRDAVRRWFEELKKKEVKPRDIKVILLGNTTVGKTTLVNYLINPDEDPDPKNSTHGILVKDWKPKELDGITVHFWDFGGQEYYHATHKYFLSNESIYLLLWDKDLNKNNLTDKPDQITYDIYYWLQNIRFFAPDRELAPVFLVQTKAFFNPETGQLADREEIISDPEITKEIKKQFAISVLETYNLQSKPDRTPFENKIIKHFETFKSELFSLIDEKLSKPVPGYWEDLRKEIQSARKNEKFWSYEHYQDVAKSFDPDINLDMCTSYLINRGEILYYPDIEGLKNIVFIDPVYITQKIYEILRRDIIYKNAEFTIDEVKQVIPDETEARWFIDLMKAPQFELIFEKPGQKGVYIAAQYLPLEMPEHLKKDILPRLKLAFGLHFTTYMPNFLSVRFLSHYGSYAKIEVERRNYWKLGAYLKIPVQGLDIPFIEALAFADLSTKRFEVYSEAKHRKSHILKTMYEKILEILFGKEKNDQFSYLTKQQASQVNLYFQKGAEMPIPEWEANYQLIKNKYKDNFEIFYNNNKINIGEYKALKTAKVPYPKTRIFVAYSSKDKELRDQIIGQLETVLKDKIEIWYDDKIIDKWEEEIAEKLKQSDIFIIFVSVNLCAKPDHYVFKEELPLAIETGKVIIPVILTNCLWKYIDGIKDADAVPDKGTPVNKFNPITDGITKAAEEIIKKINNYREKQGLE